MSVPSPQRGSVPIPSAALSAFLRGIERRAFVFALLQGGREETAERALAQAMQAFRRLSVSTPLSGWPAAFWSLLLAQSELSGAGVGVAGADLATLSSGPRAALLLRLVAGLDFPHAAQVLGVSQETFRFASERALLELADAGISYADLAELRERLHRQVKTLPAARAASLEAMRLRVLADLPEPEAPEPLRSPWPLRLLWLGLLVLAAAFAATYVLPGAPALRPGGSQALPPEPVPARPPLTDSDVVTHPDFVLLAHPDDEPLAAELALLSWLAAGADTSAITELDPAATAPPSDTTPPTDTTTEVEHVP